MKYPDGQEIRLGDRVKLGRNEEGVVVADIDNGEYSGGEHTEAQWGYLREGVMISFPVVGLIHYKESDADLRLISRKR